jgi:hypothetical protein
MKTQNPLFSRFDQDPGRYRPMFYNIEVTIPQAAGGWGEGSVTLRNQPFILTAVRHQIIGDSGLDDNAISLVQDGLYSIEMRDEQSSYQNIAGMADLMFGRAQGGDSQDLPYPIPYAGNKVLTFHITNRILRAMQSGTYWLLGITVVGVADWGELALNR